jgi:hypothetical protein
MSLATSFVLISAAVLSGSVLLTLGREDVGRDAELVRKGDREAVAACRQVDPSPGNCISLSRRCFVITETRSFDASVIMRMPIQCPSRRIIEVAKISGSAGSKRL